MDTYLAIASRREVRSYSPEPVEDAVIERILNAGRMSGSSQNRQPWHFFLVRDRTVLERLAETVYARLNILDAAFAVAIATAGGRGAFDVGRAAQNMMLAAWNEGIGSCPNGLTDASQAREVLGAAERDEVVTILSMGHPARSVDPQSRSAEQWSEAADRKPLSELVTRL